MKNPLRIYRQTYKCSEEFPVKTLETWWVRERGKAVEFWTVIGRTAKSFTVEIAEFA